MKKEYDPGRIERTIKRYRQDQENIADQTQSNRNEIGKLLREIEAANRKVAILQAENNHLEDEFKKINGKIDALQMVLDGNLPEDVA